MRITSSRVEEALAGIRWPGSKSVAEIDALLRTVANFGAYWIVLQDGKLPAAPDSKNRVLAPVFTTAAARDLFLDTLPDDQINQKLVLKLNGQQLFSKLADMQIDGIVFNCVGPQDPLAFVPQLAEQALRHIAGPTKSNETAADTKKEIVFDPLVQAAFPNGGLGGSMDALDALHHQLFALDEWIFAVHPKQAANPLPYVIQHQGRRRAYAFTDRQRAFTFAKANDLLDQDGQAVNISMTPTATLEWLGNPANRVEVLHFNFGGLGWFIPAENLPKIYARLNEQVG